MRTLLVTVIVSLFATATFAQTPCKDPIEEIYSYVPPQTWVYGVGGKFDVGSDTTVVSASAQLYRVNADGTYNPAGYYALTPSGPTPFIPNYLTFYSHYWANAFGSWKRDRTFGDYIDQTLNVKLFRYDQLWLSAFNYYYGAPVLVHWVLHTASVC